MTVTSVDMNKDGFQTCCSSLRLATALLCRMERLWEPLPLLGSRIFPANCLVETVLSWTISPSAFFPSLVSPSLASLCGHTIPSRLPCLHAVAEFARMSKDPRTTTRSWLLCTSIYFIFHVSTCCTSPITMCIASSSGFDWSITSALQRKVRTNMRLKYTQKEGDRAVSLRFCRS